MFKRSNNASKFPGFWIGPGGHIDEDEDALTAAIREVEEEAGVVVEEDSIKLKAVALHYHIDLKEVWTSFVFLAQIPKHQKVNRPNNEGVARWIPLDELFQMKNIFPPTRYYFDHVLNDKAGIMYTNIQWENSELVKVLNQKIDADF
jgi:8-oxo-dGTP diphosphatase